MPIRSLSNEGLPPFIASSVEAAEQPNQQNDGNRDSDQPQQQSATHA
jgi:hypothetical protein